MATSRGIVEQQNLTQMIKNMYYSRDGKNGYATYYSFDMEITFPEFSNRNKNVLVDCSDDVLTQRVLAIDDDELKPSSEIVKLEEDVIGEAIESVNRKKELLENLEEDLIAYKARCNRLRVRIDDRIAIVEARKLEEQARQKQQAEPLDLSCRVQEELVREQSEDLSNSLVIRIRRVDQPTLKIRRIDDFILPARPIVEQQNVPVHQPIEPEMEQPEVEIEQQEEVLNVEEFSIHSSESTSDTENGDENEVENEIYDRAIDEMENVPNDGEEAHNWAEQVLADEIIQNAQPPPLRINPPIIDLENGEPREVPIPAPQPFPDNMRFGEQALQVLREYGRDVIIRMRLNEDRPQKAMIHLSMDLRENVFGERVETEWFGDLSYLVATRTHPIPDIRCRLDGAPFVFSGIKRRYRVAIFPFVGNNTDQFIATAYLVPPMGHTPDYALERITLGADFLTQHIHSVHPGLMEITLRTTTGLLVRKRYQLRNRMRN